MKASDQAIIFIFVLFLTFPSAWISCFFFIFPSEWIEFHTNLALWFLRTLSCSSSHCTVVIKKKLVQSCPFQAYFSLSSPMYTYSLQHVMYSEWFAPPPPLGRTTSKSTTPTNFLSVLRCPKVSELARKLENNFRIIMKCENNR